MQEAHIGLQRREHREAVARTVAPGATVLFAFTHNRSHAAAYEDATLAEINRRCGRRFAVRPELERFDPPTAQELASLRRFDPQREILA